MEPQILSSHSDFQQFVIFLSKFIHILHHDGNQSFPLNGSDFIHFQAAEKKKASKEENGEKNKDSASPKQVCWDFLSVCYLHR